MPDAETPEKLKRERAGTYVTADGRFTVEQSSSGWLVLDTEQANELGLPLARGPFPTLDEARGAIAEARSGPVPKAVVLDIARRTPRADRDKRTRPGAKATTEAAADSAGTGKGAGRSRGAGASGEREAGKPAAKPKRPEKPRVVFRELRGVDGEQLRKLWTDCGFQSLGDDDLSLARLARRNPGLLLVAAEGTRIVGSALGAWDGRRGWIYRVATAPSHRRQGIASRLVGQVEAGLRDLGCPKISALVRDENGDGSGFWAARGYEQGSRQYARELTRD
ncbi:MAG TPA: GNAT family N-acetyltransferase [Candidatus Limnocylindrales bacterium]|nr:GNAT family N-acetyltransferase [Candidatus Limnocylindrales bacterium]